jgi:hypothetical protein
MKSDEVSNHFANVGLGIPKEVFNFPLTMSVRGAGLDFCVLIGVIAYGILCIWVEC